MKTVGGLFQWVKVVGLSLALLGFLAGCGHSGRKDLERRGISYSAENFVGSAKRNDIAVLKLFLNSGIDVNSRDNGGNTALMVASLRGHKEVAKLLISKGADVNAKDKYGRTPLIWASYAAHKEVAELLVSKGADVNVKDEQGNTPLMEASREDHTEVIELLKSKGAKE